ncbi:MAG TPA: capsule assembly Wzi family protein [Candidatus Angelobacter sp.]|nr:capsule assembly Wzi family protein [Candidatus Angelobacter sp.]
MRFSPQRKSIALLFVFLSSAVLHAQIADTASPQADVVNTHQASLVPRIFVKNLVQDQKDIWTSPRRFHLADLNWLLPAAGLTAGMIAADRELMSRISTTGFLARHSNTASNAGVAALTAGAGSLYFLGKMRGDDHQQETGIVTGEAALNALIFGEVLKLATQRERPMDSGGLGRFWHGGTLNSSFPSQHALVSWAAAGVLAHEYPGIATQAVVYGLAAGVSLARVTGKEHFPSDVLVGSAAGWLIGRQVYSRHHDPEGGGGSFSGASSSRASWGTFHHSDEPDGEQHSNGSIASPYVPLDSWVYPAFDRLAALGAIPSGIQGLKPWTRRECARLLGDLSDLADDPLSGNEPLSEVSRLRTALDKEFAVELGGASTPYVSLDSVYARMTSISGPPLTDGFHFGQTIVNDYGRPYQRGANFINGFSSSASIGVLGFYVRGEFEHAPSAPGFSQAVVNAIETTDQKPLVQTAAPIQAFNQFRLLDTYITLNIQGWQASYGKQSLWLSTSSDPFLSSDNAEPLYMFRVDQTSPRKLPGIFGRLGPYRVEFWVGKLTGQHFVNTQLGPDGQPTQTGIIDFSLGRTLSRQPMLNGQKINFKPTPNFEFGVGKTGLWGGPEFPITIGSTRLSLLSFGNSVGRGLDPGDRRSTADFSYRLPGLRKWLTLYEDSFVEDEISPIGYPRRAAHTPGLYLARVPGIPKMDLRAEASYTNLPGLLQPVGGGFFYWNVRYLDGYTNQGNIIGDGTVGRQGIAYRAASTYWFSSNRTLQVGYRSMEADRMFLKGGNLKDIDLRAEWAFNPAISLLSTVQYERWNFPLLAANRQNNLTASLQLTYSPQWRLDRGK